MAMRLFLIWRKFLELVTRVGSDLSRQVHIGGWNGLVYAWAMLSGLQSRSQFLEQIMLGGRLVEDDADVQPVAAAEHAMNRAAIFSV